MPPLIILTLLGLPVLTGSADHFPAAGLLLFFQKEATFSSSGGCGGGSGGGGGGGGRRGGEGAGVVAADGFLCWLIAFFFQPAGHSTSFSRATVQAPYKLSLLFSRAESTPEHF